MFGRRVAVWLTNARLARPGAAAQHDLPFRPLLAQPRRLYATPGRPKSVVGEPSRPVKRAVKRSAARATSADSPAKQKNEAKKTAAAAKKPKAKARAPKQLTEEQKAAQAQKKAKAKARKAAKTEKDKIRLLKEQALKPPSNTTPTAWTTFFAEKMKSNLSATSIAKEERMQRVADITRGIAAEYKQLTPAELEHYNHLAHTAKEESEAAYKRWVESHDPVTIQTANAARASLRRKLEANPDHKRKRSAWPPIRDERATKRPLNAYAQFSVNRNASGDFKNIRLGERSKLIAEEWKALSADEKKVCQLTSLVLS
jgi:hypothetical protein